MTAEQGAVRAAERVAGATNVDVVIVGAGFAGMYQLKRMRDAGFSAVVIEAGDGVGGTWYWNRYPGARCDILTVDYSYSWDPELESEWEWSERYATQPEILRYANFVADKHDLRRDIRFDTRVTSASWDESTKRWTVSTTDGDVVGQHYVMATGCLSVPKVPDVPGNGRFEGPTYSTSEWPHEGVDFTGMRVAVIGTGSSGIQSIPIIAEQAAQLTVFQRTPNFSMPAHHGPIADERLVEYRQDPAHYREEARHSRIGVPFVPLAELSALEVTEAERNAAYEQSWQRGELGQLTPFTDLGINAEANDTMRRFIHNKIRGIVDDPEIAELLCPTNHYFATKRPCLDTNYYATYNRPNVRLVNLLQTPIESITESGIDVTGESMSFDAIVFATGFDAMTGAIVGANITGRDGMSLRDAWADGPMTYLGLMTVGFPNLYMITGPGSPSVLSNMMVSIEQHVDWISDLVDHMRTNQLDTIEPTTLAQTKWVKHSNDIANMTLLPTANSWYMGANVPGKPSVFLPYPGGVGAYREVCDEVVERDYFGFTLAGPAGSTTNDGAIRPVQPDVAAMLAAMAEMGLPPLESLSVDEARAFVDMAAGLQPPGPDVGEIVDGVLQGADGDLEYRLYRPNSDGPHPVVVYFHGGGWVLGSHTSDDPLCRDLCVRSGAAILSVNYRHAPGARFPAAADDGFAAVQWVAAHADELGLLADQLVVAGWSAGGNVAAVACQQARDAGGPAIVGQLLLNPAADCDLTRPSYIENGEGYVLTTSLMTWFWDHYCDPEQRSDPKASPLRAESLADLPPTMIVTCEFDPLRDEGDAYAEALAAAGVPVEHLQAEGHTHTSTGAVDVLITPIATREIMANALRGFFGANVPA